VEIKKKKKKKRKKELKGFDVQKNRREKERLLLFKLKIGVFNFN
jgi:hypothetical protein